MRRVFSHQAIIMARSYGAGGQRAGPGGTVISRTPPLNSASLRCSASSSPTT